LAKKSPQLATFMRLLAFNFTALLAGPSPVDRPVNDGNLTGPQGYYHLHSVATAFSSEIEPLVANMRWLLLASADTSGRSLMFGGL